MANNNIIKEYETKIQELLAENLALFNENVRLRHSDSSKNTTNKGTTSKGSTKKTRKTPNKTAHSSKTNIRKIKAKNLPLVAEYYKNKMSLEEIASKINKSVPTVRLYIKELKQNGMLEK